MLHRNGKTIAKSLIAVAVVVMFIMGTASVFAEVDDHTVVGKNPQGTVINLFDYWVNEQDSDDHNPNPDLNSGINKNRDLKFSMGNNAPGMNWWTGSSAPYSGMVQNTLNSNGYPDLVKSGNITSPLDYLFNENDSTTDGLAKVEGKKAYTNVDGLMQVNDDGYYYYDSTRNFASYDSTTNGMKLYNQPAVQFGKTKGQFFPFNSGSQVFYEENKSLRAKDVNAASNNVNHWFGVSMSTHFMQPVDGKTTTNEDITYEFSGDDDVWVYIDGVLVGDLGGIHDAASLNINFSTGAISINGKSDGTLKSKYEAAGKQAEVQWDGNTYADNTYHTLKFFYLERGNHASNMSLKFNLKLMPDNEISKVDQYGNAVKGAEYALYQATRTETNGETAYKETGRQLCSGSTSANGSLILKADDGATINFEELYKKGIGPYYILEETKAPDGYRKTKPVWLEYDPKTGAVTTENQWDSGIHANSRIMITAPTDLYYDRNNAKIDKDADGKVSGSVFAVVYKRTGDSISDDSNWSAVSGSVLDGWQLHTADTTEHVLQGNKYEMKLNSMGAYETTLDELPGDIMTYSNVIVADNKGKTQEEILQALKDKAQYSICYYYTTGDVKDASVSNTKRLDTGILSTNRYAKEYDYQYAVKLTATDVTNDLYVQKQSSTSVGFNNTCINGVKFALYPEDQTTLLSGLPGRDVKLQEGAKPVQEQVTGTIGADVAGSELYGSAVFKKLKNGIYYLKEISAPSGYKLNEKLVKVVVNDNGVYADAGTQGDGVLVSRGGYGMLLKSMEQFAENNDINTTLTNMIAKLRVSEREPNVDGTWDKPMEFGADMHLRYNYDLEQGGTGHYQIWSQDNEGHENFSEITENMEAFSTDTGWPSVVLNQCQEHDTGSKTAKKTDLGNKDLSHLFVLDTIVAVQDEPVGDLEISKKVENNSSGISYSDKAFDFTVNLTEYDTQDKVTGSNRYKPLSGTFQYTVTHKNGTQERHLTLTTNQEGVGVITLKDGETALIEDLPAGAHYKVTEEADSCWKVSSTVTGAVDPDGPDGPAFRPIADGKVVTGSIPKPDDNGNKQKQIAEYTNTYDPTPATLKLPVEKLFNGWNLDSFKDQTFAIRLTGLESTGGDIKDTMPGAVEDTQDNHWYLTKSIGNNETASHDDGPLTVTPFVSSTSEFTGLNFTKTGQYAYTIKEIQGDHQDISYSAAIYEVLVTVTDNPDTGKLTASYTMKKTINNDGTSLTQEPQPNGTATFKNEYKNKTANVNFSVHKTYTNATGSDTLTDDQFQFQLEPVTDKAPMPEGTENNKYTASTTAGGRTAFPNITYNTEDQGKKFVYKVSEVVPGNAVDGKLAGTTYDMNTYYIRVTVSGTGSAVNAEIKYYKDADCTREVPENEMYTIGDEHRLWFHNSYTAEPAKATIQGSKTLNGRDMAANEFGFTLEGADKTTREAMNNGSFADAEDGKLSVNAPAAENGNPGTFEFPEMTFKHVGTYTFKVAENIPQDAQNNKLNGVTYDTNVGTVTVQVTDKDANGNKTGQLNATVSYENSKHQSTNLAQFVNKYAESGSAQIEGTKNLTGRDFKDGDSFTFTVTPQYNAPAPKDKDGKDISEVTITPDSGTSAKIDFGTVNFNQAGQSYTYELKEKPDGDKKGIEYDATTYTLTLTAKANSPMNGKLTIEQTLKAGDQKAEQIVWNNQYKPTGSLRLDATKTLTGRDWNDEDSFSFELWAMKDDTLQSALAEDTKYEDHHLGTLSFQKVTVKAPEGGAKNGQKVPIDFNTLHFTKAGSFVFYITEIVPGNDDKNEGMIYDSEDHRIPVYVTDDGEGHLTAKVADNSITNLNFNNVYNSSVEYSNKAGLVIQKTLNGRDMTAGQFEFTVEAQDSTAVTAHQAAGKLGFGQGETKKTFQSGAANDGQSSSIDILSGQTVSFNQDDAGKTFRYKVTETKGGADGYTNDKTKYQVDLAVQDRGAGAMEVTTTVTDVTHDPNNVVSTTEVSSGDSDDKKIAVIPFTNSYSASGDLGGKDSAKIKASKTLNGRDMKKGEFTFQVTNAKDTKEQKTVLSTGKNAAAKDGKPGAVDFAEIKYTTAQMKQDVENDLAVKEGNKYTYQYEVSEVTENLPAGVSPEEGSFAVTVTVTDNGDGTLTAAVTYPDDKNKLEFVNEYDTKEVLIPIKGIKSLKLEGEAAMTIEDIEGKYDFALTGKETTAGADGTAPMPTLNGKTMTSAKNDKTGEIDFGHITLQASDFEGITADEQGNRTRTFEYKITEKGNVDGVVNDREATKNVSITVMYNSKEKSFHVTGVPEDAAFQFINIYGITSTDVSADTLFSVNKILKGRDLKDGEFQFELLELVDDEAVVIAKGTTKAASAGKASAVDFGKITYDAPGEHDYLIREVVPSGGRDADTVYDTRSYSVHVSVTDQKDGTLKVTSDVSTDKPMTFTNKQVSKNPSGGDSTGDNGGNGGSHTRTGDQTPVGMAILLLMISACAGTLVLGIRRSSAK